LESYYNRSYAYFGKWRKAEKDAILNAEQTIANNLGLTPSEMALTVATNKTQFVAIAKTITQQSELQANVSQFEETAKNNLATATIYSNQIDRNGSPLINSWLQGAGKLAGDPKLQAFDVAIKTFASEYAKVMSGSTGSGGTPISTQAEALDMIKLL